MKKILSIISVFALSMAFFLTTPSIIGNNDGGIDLSSLTMLSTANAQEAGEPNYSYLQALESEEVYDTVYELEGGLKVKNVPIGAVVLSTYYNEFVGVNKNCDWALARCDQNQVGFYPAGL